MADEPAPLRFISGFGGMAMRTDGDNSMPLGSFLDGSVPRFDNPLAAVLDELTFVRGLAIPQGDGAGTAPPGGRYPGVFSYHWHVNPLFTGMRQDGDNDSTIITGPSADQVAATHLGQNTLFPSLTLRTQAVNYAASPGFRNTPSFTQSADGVVAPITPITSPNQLFQSLMYGIAPDNAAALAEAEVDRVIRQSVLDSVDRRMGGMVTKLSGDDQRRLNLHFEEIRELERRLDIPAVAQGGACTVPIIPDDPPIGQAYSGEARRSQTFRELIRLALACDLTRVIAWMQSPLLPSLDTNFLGHDGDMHMLQHSQTQEELWLIMKWHMAEWAALVTMLRDTDDGGQSLLSRCAMVYQFEGGAGLPDTTLGSHQTDDMMSIIAGQAGGLVKGQHLVAQPGQDHPVNVTITAMRAAGVNIETLGEVTGEISGLRA